MDIARFELEFWLNPLDDKAEYNFGSSCCKPVTVGEMLELTGTDREESGASAKPRGPDAAGIGHQLGHLPHRRGAPVLS